MTASSGNHDRSPREAEDAPRPRLEPPVPALAVGVRKNYRKPELSRLGRLRSVTGSNLTW